MEKATSSWFHVQAAPGAAAPDLSLALATAGSGGDADWEVAPTARVNGKMVRLFPCLFCDKTFLKSQALGGHQNAHRKDRFFNDPYDDGATGRFGGPLCDPGAGRSMRNTVASHGGGAAASAASAAIDGCRLQRWSAGAPRFDGSGVREGAMGRSNASDVASVADEALDLELRL